MDTVDVQWRGYTDEVEAFGFVIIENGRGVYGPTIFIHNKLTCIYIYIMSRSIYFRQIVRCFFVDGRRLKLSLRHWIERTVCLLGGVDAGESLWEAGSARHWRWCQDQNAVKRGNFPERKVRMGKEFADSPNRKKEIR
jgi:hypothetical protein